MPRCAVDRRGSRRIQSILEKCPRHRTPAESEQSRRNKKARTEVRALDFQHAPGLFRLQY